MSRAVMQQALEALNGVLDTYGEPLDRLSIAGGPYEALECRDAITALRAALAEPAQNLFGDDAERYARKLHEEREAYKAIFTERKPQTTHWEGCEAVHPECKEKNT